MIKQTQGQKIRPQLSIQILVKLVECILQSRIDVHKKQIRKFDEVNKELQKKRQKAYDGKIKLFLSSLVLQQKFRFNDLIKSQQEHVFIKIVLSLKDRLDKKNIIKAEVWTITFDKYNNFEQEYSPEQFLTLTTIFEEMLLFLNQQPLFHQYQRNPKLKQKYTIDYQIQVLSQSPSTIQQQYNILNMNNKYVKERICRYLGLNIICYFIPKSHSCWNSSYNKFIGHVSVNKSKEQKTCDTSNKNRKYSDNQIITGQQHKTSYYQIYDKELDFVFLSSDDQEFRRHPSSQIKQMNLDLQQSQEFVLLTLSKDEELVSDNKDMIDQLVSMEIQYLMI